MCNADKRVKARTGYHGYRLMGSRYRRVFFLSKPPADRSFQFSPGGEGGYSRI